jgi:hypothetical protein
VHAALLRWFEDYRAWYAATFDIKKSDLKKKKNIKRIPFSPIEIYFEKTA